MNNAFDVSIGYINNAYRIMVKDGVLADRKSQFMYFETSQGSEVSYGMNNGVDMTTYQL